MEETAGGVPESARGAVTAGDVLLVHTPSLQSFARALGSSGTVAANDVRVMFANGAVFGAGHPSADVVAAIDTYIGCLGAMTGQLAAHVNAASILAEAGERIAREYASADAASGGTVGAASSRSPAARPSAGGSASGATGTGNGAVSIGVVSIGAVTAALTDAVAAVDVPEQLLRPVLRDGTVPD